MQPAIHGLARISNTVGIDTQSRPKMGAALNLARYCSQKAAIFFVI
jgi:hypothetical protein